MSTVYTIQEITSIANSNYQELLDTDVWQVPDSDTAFTSTSNRNKNNRNNNDNKGNRRCGRWQNNNGGNNNNRRNPNHPNTPPKPGQPQKRKWKGITLYWCAKCKAWRCHNTDQHIDSEEYNKSRENN